MATRRPAKKHRKPQPAKAKSRKADAKSGGKSGSGAGAGRSLATIAAPRGRSRRFGFAALSAGVAALGIGAMLAGLFARRKATTGPAGHRAPDLAPGRPRPGPTDRAPDAFRPDPTAPVPAELRESLRPATGPAPGFAADRGATTGV